MLVKNIKGSGLNYPRPKICRCSNWIDHWIVNKYKPTICYGCGLHFNTSKLVGGHVKKCNSDDNSLYIIPLCNSCNGKDGEVFNVNIYDLVPMTKCRNI